MLACEGMLFFISLTVDWVLRRNDIGFGFGGSADRTRPRGGDG